MPRAADFRVYVVDDDPACRDSLTLLLDLKGFESIACASAEEFFARFVPDRPSCVLLDFRMPVMNGLEVQLELARRGWNAPLVMLSAHGDVATTRNALKSGALDFLEKPVDADQLLEVVTHAHQRAVRAGEIARRLARLTPREREVMQGVVAGWQNREIADALGISPRTVEVYKARVMLKLEVERVPELIRLVSPAGDLHESGGA